MVDEGVNVGVNVLDGELDALVDDVLIVSNAIMRELVVGDGLLLNTLLMLVLEAAAAGGVVVAEVVVSVARVNAS